MNATRSLVVAATAAAAVAVVAASVSPALSAVILNAIAHHVLVVGQPEYLGAMQTSRSITRHDSNSINKGIYPMVW